MTLSSYVHSDLAQRTEFMLATEKDDPAICRFLEKQSMHGGKMSLVTRTEPSFFAAARLMGEDPQVMVAKRAGAIVGLGVRTKRRVWLNRQVVRVGHLSYLRLGEAVRRRRDFLRAGYGFLHELQRADPVPFHLTAILDDNVPAKRLLEAGLRGLPRYAPLTKVMTFTFSTRRVARQVRYAAGSGWWKTAADIFKNQPLAPVSLRVADSLKVNTDWIAIADAERIRAVGSIWDQREVRQVMLTNVPRVMRMARPLINLVSPRKMPPADVPINLAFISQFAVKDGPALQAIVPHFAANAARGGIDYLALSVAEGPLSDAAARFGAHVTRSTLYAVHWEADAGCPPLSSLPYVEAGLL